MNKSKQLWRFPWRYRESFLIVAGVILTGFLLQLIVGQFNFFLLHRPVNYGLAIFILLASCFLASSKKNIPMWFGGVPAAVSLMSGILLLSILMGVIPQIASHKEQHSLIARLGLDNITGSWPFVLLYVFLLFSLCTVCLRRVRKFSRKNLLFLLNHGGLWLALAAAGLGAADMQRHIMYVPEGEVEWRVYTENGDMLELPIAIRLHDFDIETYPPKLALIDRATGVPLPEGKAEWLQLQAGPSTGRLGEWEITVKEYIHQAVWAGNNSYREMYMPGSAPAVKITAENKKTGARHEGWVSCGNLSQFTSALPLEENLALVMAQPEPKRFVSDISVATQDGEKTSVLLEVNSPLRIGNWMIYQYGYDDKAGKLSSYSSFELVYDPWLPAVYAGLIAMSAGALMLIWSGKRKREKTT